MLFREALRKQAFFAQQKNAHTATVMLSPFVNNRGIRQLLA
jgi:hypothetical protein